jgi:hypothetical protein
VLGTLIVLNAAPENSRIRFWTMQKGLHGNWINSTMIVISALTSKALAALGQSKSEKRPLQAEIPA